MINTRAENMDKKILFLTAIFAICLILVSPAFARENVNVKITTEDHPFAYEGYIEIKLTDKNGQDIKKGGTINYTITDSDGNYEWEYKEYNGKISVKVPNGKYKVDVKFDGDSQHNKAALSKTVTIQSDGSSNAYNYYDNHNYGDNSLYDDYIYDSYWDEEIYDDASNYDGEGY